MEGGNEGGVEGEGEREATAKLQGERERERVARAPVQEWERLTRAGGDKAGREISYLANSAHGLHCIDVKWNRSSS